MDKLSRTFYEKTYENEINKKMLFYSYIFPTEDVLRYTHDVINIPVSQLLEVVLSMHKEEQIAPKDVFQFSNLEDATFRVCQVIKEINNPGVNTLEAGNLLLDDDKKRKKTAIVKYGENHVKTAEAFGLLYELTHVYFLSCLGCIQDLLSKEEKKKLLLRLVLRNKLIRNMYVASFNGEVHMRQFLYMLSDSTYVRRRSNIRSILNVLEESDEYNFSEFLSRISFP